MQGYVPNEKKSADPERGRRELENLGISPLSNDTLATCPAERNTTYLKIWQLGFEVCEQAVAFTVHQAVDALQVHEIEQHRNQFVFLLGIFRRSVDRRWRTPRRSLDPIRVNQSEPLSRDHLLTPLEISSGGDEGMSVRAGHGHEVKDLEDVKGRLFGLLHPQDHPEKDLSKRALGLELLPLMSAFLMQMHPHHGHEPDEPGLDNIAGQVPIANELFLQWGEAYA